MVYTAEQKKEMTRNWIVACLKKCNLTQEKIAESLGISKQAITKWKKSGSIETTNILAICRICKCEKPGWLQTGEGNINNVVGSIDTAFEIDSASGLLAANGDNFTRPQHNFRPVPRISSVSAGDWQTLVDDHPPIVGDDPDICTVPCSEYTVSFSVSGDSMTAPFGNRSFPNGTIIFVDPIVKPETGFFVIAQIKGENEVTFKQFIQDGSRQYLKPLNPNYPIITDEFNVLGVVISSFQKLI